MRYALNGPTPTILLNTQTECAQHLARSALSIVGTLNAQPMYHSPEIRAVYARVRQEAGRRCGTVHCVQLGQRGVRDLKPQVDQRDQEPVDEDQALLGPGAGRPPPVAATPLV